MGAAHPHTAKQRHNSHTSQASQASQATQSTQATLAMAPGGDVDDDDAAAAAAAAATCHITVSELLLILADLVSTVPGVATCVHRFHTSSRPAHGSHGGPTPSRFHPALPTPAQWGVVPSAHKTGPWGGPSWPSTGPLAHCIHGAPLHSQTFVAFLVHRLLVPPTVPKAWAAALALAEEKHHLGAKGPQAPATAAARDGREAMTDPVARQADDTLKVRVASSCVVFW